MHPTSRRALMFCSVPVSRAISAKTGKRIGKGGSRSEVCQGSEMLEAGVTLIGPVPTSWRRTPTGRSLRLVVGQHRDCLEDCSPLPGSSGRRGDWRCGPSA